MSSASLFSDELREELDQLPRPHPSFLVSLLTREEPAIQTFRGQLEDWWGHVEPDARSFYGDRLVQLENEVFFQAFSELAMHEILRYHDISVGKHASRPGGWMTVRSRNDCEFGLGTVAYLPEVQLRGSSSVYRHLVRELNQIHHHYHFSVYLKKWLPYDFDPRPIKRALQVWLDSLDDGDWQGKYAEYRDDSIHVEFSILDKLNQDRRSLVRFRISPLHTPEVLESIGSCVHQLVTSGDSDAPAGRPLVATVFSNEHWTLPQGFMQDYIYGKPDYSFHWTTHNGRREHVRSYQQASSKYGLFSDSGLSHLSAVVLADKEWARDKVVFSMRVLHNPWAEHPLPLDCFGSFAQFTPIDGDGTTAHLAWKNAERTSFRMA